jgi:hypothetical protein
MKSLQKFASVHASVHNYFALERHLVNRQTFQAHPSAALAEQQWSRVRSLLSKPEHHRGRTGSRYTDSIPQILCRFVVRIDYLI